MKFTISLCTYHPTKLKTLATAAKLDDAVAIAAVLTQRRQGQECQIWLQARFPGARFLEQLAGHCCDSEHPKAEAEWKRSAEKVIARKLQDRKDAAARHEWIKAHGSFDTVWSLIQSNEPLRLAFYANRFDECDRLYAELTRPVVIAAEFLPQPNLSLLQIA